MASASISVARLLQLRVPIAWQEAVEVTRLAGIAAEGHSSPISLAGCLLGDDGSVVLSGGGTPVSAMQLLGAMLDGQSAPPELLTLVMLGHEAPSGFSTPTQERPKGLSLEWFVRPNPEVEVAKLASRGLAAEAAQAHAASIAELRAHVSEQPPAPPKPVVKKPLPLWVRPVGVAAAVTVAVAGVWFAWSRWGGGVDGTLAFVENVPTTIASVVNAAYSGNSPTVAASSTAADAKPGAAARSSSSPASNGAGRRTSSAPVAAGSPAPALAESVSASAPVQDGEDDEPYVVEEVVVYPLDSRVYSEQDPGVAPPTMVYPQMPSQLRADAMPRSSYLEVVVDERGEVQRVRLRSADATLNDRMIVSAAKTWRFEPARLDGVPVKYTMRVPVTQ